MPRAGKIRKRADKEQLEAGRQAERAKLERSVNRLMLGLLAVAVTIFVGLYWHHGYSHRKASNERFRQKHNLSEEQLQRTIVLEREHHERYRPLADRARESERQFLAAQRDAKAWTPELQRLLDEANATSEACWTEEIEHHRRMSEAMPPDEGKRYREKEELRYQQRKPDARGLLPLPHK